MSVKFIPDELVITIQHDLLDRYGGQNGIRDINLLQSALAQPKVMISGKYLHKTKFDKAAAYGFHVCINHPFIDGNKRIAFVLMDIFLQLKGWEITAANQEAYIIMMTLTSGKLTRKELSKWLRKNSAKIS